MTENCKRPEMCLLSETCVPCAICPNAKEKADDRLALTARSPSSFPAMPLAAALEFADSGESTGGIMTHEALKTLAAAIRGKRCEFCNEPPLTENERKFLSDNAYGLARRAVDSE